MTPLTHKAMPTKDLLAMHSGFQRHIGKEGLRHWRKQCYQLFCALAGSSVVVHALRNDDSVVWSGSTTYFDTMRVVDVVRDGRESAAMAKADGY